MSLNYFLYRAVACVRQDDDDSGPSWPEMHVFFEAPAGVRPIVELGELLLGGIRLVNGQTVVIHLRRRVVRCSVIATPLSWRAAKALEAIWS